MQLKQQDKIRLKTTSNFLLFGIVLFCLGWLVHLWFCKWTSSIIEFSDLLSMGFGLITAIIEDPGTPESISVITTIIIALSSAYIQIRKIWRKRVQ